MGVAVIVGAGAALVYGLVRDLVRVRGARERVGAAPLVAQEERGAGKHGPRVNW